jgi:hypothetical protein
MLSDKIEEILSIFPYIDSAKYPDTFFSRFIREILKLIYKINT